jgi:hypothetical protein
VRLATPADDPGLRALLRSVAMPGDVAVRFAREPDYFLGTTIMGDPCDVVVARRGGAVVGVACRAERPAFVNGREERLGYVGQIRIAAGSRGGRLLALGARVMAERTPPGQLAFGVLARANPRAAGALVGTHPPGGVHVARLGGLTTCALLLRPRRPFRAPGVTVRPATSDVLGTVVAFLRSEGRRRQFFPAYALADFGPAHALRGLAPGDVQVAWRGDRVVGTMAAWDQSAYKQDVVDGYGPGLRRLRPLYDLAARVVAARPLTPPGEAIALDFAALTCVAGDDPLVARALVNACARHAHRRGKAYLMVGLADDDPLLAVVRRHLHVTYRSDLYALSWSGEPAARLDGRVPYVEVATL